jgi:hypothetical protein
MFLWHFPSLHNARPLAGTLPYGVRTFLSHRRNGTSGHPARWRFSIGDAAGIMILGRSSPLLSPPRGTVPAVAARRLR